MGKYKERSFAKFVHGEVERIGLLEADSAFGGLIGRSVVELAEIFDKDNHSGESGMLVASIFYHLAQFKPLSDITNDPDEWEDVSSEINPHVKSGLQWRSRRSPAIFSPDGGKTWKNYHTNETGISSEKGTINNVVRQTGVEGSPVTGSSEDKRYKSPEVPPTPIGGSPNGEASLNKRLPAQPSAKPKATPSTGSSKESGNLEGSKQSVDQDSKTDSSQSTTK